MDEIICDNTDLSSTQLVDLFTRISKQSIYHNYYTLSIVRNNNLTELRANTFQNVTFKEIEISYCPNLVDVHEEAFSGTEANVTELYWSLTGNFLLKIYIKYIS